MNKNYTPYNFDEKIEYKIYLNIGQRYKRESMGKKSKVNKKYPDFDKYTEWEKYFKNKFINENSDKNFKHFLKNKLRMYQCYIDAGKSVVTPICIAAITILLTIYATMGFSIEVLLVPLLVGLIIIMFYLTYLVWEHDRKVNFFEDCINIIDNEESGPQ